MEGARRASICSSMSGDIGVDALDLAAHVQELVMVGWIGGVDSRYGSTADQGRTGREDSSSRLWRPARALGTHAKQGPSTGHSAVGLRQAEKCLLTPRPHFTAPPCTLGNQVVRTSDGPPFRQESRPTRLCRTPGAGSVLPLSRALAVIKRVTRAFVSWTVFSTRPRDRCSPCFPWEQICQAGSILERFRVLRDAESVNTRSVRSLSTRHA
jgi:hypothetical protein